MLTLHGHAADGIEQDDVRSRRDRGLLQSAGLATGERGRSRRGDEVGPTATDGDELGEDRQGDLCRRLGAEVQARGSTKRGEALGGHAGLLPEPGPDGDRPSRRRDEPGVGDVAHERGGQRLLVPLALRRDDDVRRDVERQTGQVRLGDDPPGCRERIRGRDRVDEGDGEAGRGTELDERPRDRGGAGDPQRRGREDGFHVDLQGATGVAGHEVVDDTVAATRIGRHLLRDPKQTRLAVDEGPEGLLDDDRLGAAAADPALDPTAGMDDPAGSGPSRGRPDDRDDGRHGEGSALRHELGGPGEDPARAAARVADYAVTPFSRRIAQIF